MRSRTPLLLVLLAIVAAGCAQVPRVGFKLTVSAARARLLRNAALDALAAAR